MEFWLGLYGMQSPRTHPRAFPWLYDEVVRHAVEAEKLGYDGFALTEHHFWYDGYCPSLLPVLAAIARQTDTIRILPCALLLPLRDPLRVAEEIAVLDHLSHGRLTLALGLGYRAEEFEGFGLEKNAVGPRFSEMIEVLRKAFSEESFSHKGEHFSYDNIALAPKPYQKEIPMWLAGGGQPASAHRAARAGLPYCVAAVSQPFERVGELIGEYHKAADEAGIKPNKVAVATDVVIAETREEVDRIVAEDLIPVYTEQLISFGFLRDEDGNPIKEIPPDHPMFEVLLGSFILGTPDEVIERLEAFQGLGADVFVPRMVEANFRSERLMGEMRLFSERVLPHFKGRAGK